MQSSIATALLLIFPPHSEKNVGVKYVRMSEISSPGMNTKILKWRFRSFVQPGNSF